MDGMIRRAPSTYPAMYRFTGGIDIPPIYPMVPCTAFPTCSFSISAAITPTRKPDSCSLKKRFATFGKFTVAPLGPCGAPSTMANLVCGYCFATWYIADCMRNPTAMTRL